MAIGGLTCGRYGGTIQAFETPRGIIEYPMMCFEVIRVAFCAIGAVPVVAFVDVYAIAGMISQRLRAALRAGGVVLFVVVERIRSAGSVRRQYLVIAYRAVGIVIIAVIPGIRSDDGVGDVDAIRTYRTGGRMSIIVVIGIRSRRRVRFFHLPCANRTSGIMLVVGVCGVRCAYNVRFILLIAAQCTRPIMVAIVEISDGRRECMGFRFTMTADRTLPEVLRTVRIGICAVIVQNTGSFVRAIANGAFGIMVSVVAYVYIAGCCDVHCNAGIESSATRAIDKMRF